MFKTNQMNKTNSLIQLKNQTISTKTKIIIEKFQTKSLMTNLLINPYPDQENSLLLIIKMKTIIKKNTLLKSSKMKLHL